VRSIQLPAFSVGAQQIFVSELDKKFKLTFLLHKYVIDTPFEFFLYNILLNSL